MEKYKVIKKWVGVKVGQVLEEDSDGKLNYQLAETRNSQIITPHEVATLVATGFLEEVDDKKWPSVGDHYWRICDEGASESIWRNDSTDHTLRDGLGIYPSRADAVAIFEKLKKVARGE